MKSLAIIQDKVWGADLADMSLISKYNKGYCFTLFVNSIYSKHACVVSLKGKDYITIDNAFENVFSESVSADLSKLSNLVDIVVKKSCV